MELTTILAHVLHRFLEGNVKKQTSVSLTLVRTVGLAWMVCTNSPVCVEALTEGNDVKPLRRHPVKDTIQLDEPPMEYITLMLVEHLLKFIVTCQEVVGRSLLGFQTLMLKTGCEMMLTGGMTFGRHRARLPALQLTTI